MATILKLATADKPEPDLRSVPTLLRNIAKEIEEGGYGIKEAQAQFGEDVICRGALVLRVSCQGPQVFGLGDTDSIQTFMDFHAGAVEILGMRSPERA